MKLSEKQRLFSRLLIGLLAKIHDEGYECTLGDAYRDPRVHGEYGVKGSYASSKSNHKLRLAIDLNLFKNGKYIKDSAQYKQFGEWWESLHPETAWGGQSDGNHFSMKHKGRW